MKNWVALLYWILVFAFLIGSWISNKTISGMSAFVICFTITAFTYVVCVTRDY